MDIFQLFITMTQLFLIKYIVDQVQLWGQTGQASTAGLWKGTCLLGLVMIVGAIATRILLLAWGHIDEIGTYETERIILQKSSRLPLTLLESPEVKDLRARAFLSSLNALFLNGLQYVCDGLHIVVLLAILAWMGHPGLAIGIVLLVLIMLPIRAKAAQGVEELKRKQTPRRRMVDYIAGLAASRKPAKEIRLFGLGEHLLLRWSSLYTLSSKETIASRVKEEQVKLLPEMSMSLSGGLTAAVILLLSGIHGKTAGDFTLLLQASAMLFGLLPGWIERFGLMRQSAMRWEDLQQFLALPEDARFVGSASDMSPDEGTSEKPKALSLDVRNLTFAYPDAPKPALRDLSFQLRPGQKVAVVGENGSGKSTLVKLLLGLYDPEAGSIHWQASIGAHPDERMNEAFSVVLQDFARFNLRVRENVALGQIERINEDGALQQAMRRADVADVLPLLDERIGPEFGGRELSGGQWQKLAAARAYFRGGSVVFFDEPTAALDPRAEKEAFASFLDIVRDRSAILVTHRLGAVKLVDWILVLKEGRLIEQGTHEQLMGMQGEYARLYNLQSAWYL